MIWFNMETYSEKFLNTKNTAFRKNIDNMGESDKSEQAIA